MLLIHIEKYIFLFPLIFSEKFTLMKIMIILILGYPSYKKGSK